MLQGMPGFSLLPARRIACLRLHGFSSRSRFPLTNKPMRRPYRRRQGAGQGAPQTSADRSWRQLVSHRRLLARTMGFPQFRKFIASHYEVMVVDIGRFDRNLDILAQYGIRDRMEGVPTVLIVDPRSMTPPALADWTK
ncbi:MAG: hypothetical protein V4472_09670 [Pseudomonadota bacterium]